MDIRRLQAFCQVYILRSFSKAGEALQLSQPTISAHVLALEDEIGMPLFDRLGRAILPTQAGEVLFTHAQAVFDELEQARVALLALTDRVAGELAIGGSTIPAHYIIPKLAARFHAAFPEVRLRLEVGDTQEITEQVLDGRVLVGLVGGPTPLPELECRPFLDDALELVAPRALPVPDLTGNDWRERLLSLPWIMREPGSGTQRALVRAGDEAACPLRSIVPVLTVHSSLAALECVDAGLGVAVVSHLAARAYLDRGTVARLATPHLPMRRQFYTVHHARRGESPALAAFLEACGSI